MTEERKSLLYKLEPLIAAALALGLAHAVATWLARHPGRQAAPSFTGLQRIYTLEARAVVGVVLIGLMLPYLSGQVLNPGSFTAVPRYWYQVAGFLAARSPMNTALVVPGDAHGTYLWGDPIDDPLVALAKSPWAERGLVPYGGAGSQILLDTAENAIESGEQVSGLPGYLQRAGVRYVVVRNDLDPRQVGYTSAAVVHQTLALSGFTRVASFGPPIGGKQLQPRATRAQQAAVPSFPAVEVYAPAGSSGPPSPVGALPASQTVLVNGGPDSLLQLTGQHLLGPGQPAIIAGDPLPSASELRVMGPSWMRGLAEAASELRRHLLDRLRDGDLARGEELLAAMDDAYDALVIVDFPDAITHGLRRTLDSLRAVLERTRGDVTAAVLQQRLRDAIDGHMR